MERNLILGIDPGTIIMGYSLLRQENNKCEFVEMGVVKMDKYKDHHERLKKILESTFSLINRHKPAILSIESPFYAKNPQSMLKLGRAQGVVIAASLYSGLDVYEYSPRKIKQSITGNGSASKEQVAAMLYNVFSIEQESEYLDATDSVAVAYCHFLQNKLFLGKEKLSGWESFLSKNKDRIVK